MNEQRDDEAEISQSIDLKDIKTAAELGPIKALLSPTMELLGVHLRSKVELWLTTETQSNAAKHIDAVLSDDEKANPDFSEQAQLDLFDWAPKAGKISTDESEMSAAVRASLRATLDGSRDDAKILEELTKEEILFLTKISSEYDREYAAEKLSARGLIKQGSLFNHYAHRVTLFENLTVPTSTGWVASLVLFVGALGLSAQRILQTFAGSIESGPIAIEDIIAYIFPFGILFYALSLMPILVFSTTTTYLTSKGESISRQLKRYLSTS